MHVAKPQSTECEYPHKWVSGSLIPPTPFYKLPLQNTSRNGEKIHILILFFFFLLYHEVVDLFSLKIAKIAVNLQHLHVRW